ncbi:MFS transporter [Nocardia takedensis]|uniref:MFS transporter n=1 Tax=Nocardia takedensis TaxID=259390 RepID=UPI0002E19BA7|nr:MFS transporter [Nocardia takedensis]
MTGSVTVEPFAPRTLMWTVFVPMAVYSLGFGAAAPMYVLRALDLGASPGTAGLMVGLTGFGMVLADLPAGSIVARIGERGAIVVGSAVGVLGVIAALWAPGLGVFALGMVLIGVSGAVWGLARQSYLVAVVAPSHRGRALSMMAGASRFGTFCGPFLGALPVHALGPDGALWMQLITTVISAAAMMAISVDGDRAGADTRSMRVVVVENRRVLATLGSGALLVGAARSARLTLLPLCAAQVGVGAAATSVIFGIAGAVDVLMSYPAGVWIDRGPIIVGVMSAVTVLGAAAVTMAATSAAGAESMRRWFPDVPETRATDAGARR